VNRNVTGPAGGGDFARPFAGICDSASAPDRVLGSNRGGEPLL